MSGVVIVPWYCTGFRADQFERDLGEIAAVALRYGASSYAVYRSRDDRYRMQQFATFEDHLDWERYWEGPELVYFRAQHSSWYQVPQLYGWWDMSVSGALATESGSGANGHGSGAKAGGSV